MKKLIAIFSLIALLLTFVACDGTGSSNSKGNGNNNNSFFNKVEETEPPTYWVTFYTNGGEKIEAVKTTKIEVAPYTEREQHVFDGWYLDEQLTQSAVFPLTLTDHIILYAKWLRIESITSFADACLKNWDGNSPSATYMISPNGFDLEELAKRGYTMTIHVDYTVYYRKDYDVPLNVGYAGAPEYDVMLYNSQNRGNFKQDIKASTSAVQGSIEFTNSVGAIKNETLYLEFATENIQNKIYFNDIKVTYSCYK